MDFIHLPVATFYRSTGSWILSMGRTPQIGTKRVSVTSQKTIFFPFRFSKIEITNIKYTCHNEEKRQWSSSHSFCLDLRQGPIFSNVTLTRWVLKSIFAHAFCAEKFLNITKYICAYIQMNFRLKKHCIYVTLTQFLSILSH